MVENVLPLGRVTEAAPESDKISTPLTWLKEAAVKLPADPICSVSDNPLAPMMVSPASNLELGTLTRFPPIESPAKEMYWFAFPATTVLFPLPPMTLV